MIRSKKRRVFGCSINSPSGESGNTSPGFFRSRGTHTAARGARERIYIPSRAQFNIEHERGSDSEEIEFQIKWQR